MNKISADPAQVQLLPEGRGGGLKKRKSVLGKEAWTLPRLPLQEPMPSQTLFID